MIAINYNHEEINYIHIPHEYKKGRYILDIPIFDIHALLNDDILKVIDNDLIFCIEGTEKEALRKLLLHNKRQANYYNKMLNVIRKELIK